MTTEHDDPLDRTLEPTRRYRALVSDHWTEAEMDRIFEAVDGDDLYAMLADLMTIIDRRVPEQCVRDTMWRNELHRRGGTEG